jgi:hypothetical protein
VLNCATSAYTTYEPEYDHNGLDCATSFLMLSIIFFSDTWHLQLIVVFIKKMFAAFVDVSPEELQQKELQSSLESVDVKTESTKSEIKEDTEQQVGFFQNFGNRLPVQFVVIYTCLMILKGSYEWSCFYAD